MILSNSIDSKREQCNVRDQDLFGGSGGSDEAILEMEIPKNSSQGYKTEFFFFIFEELKSSFLKEHGNISLLSVPFM